MGGPDPMMGDPMAGGADPMAGAPGMPPTNNDPTMGDGTDDGNTMQGSSDQQELDDIFNNASIEDKNAILKYAKSQTENDSGNEGEQPQQPMQSESKHYKDKLVNEIINSIMGDFDMNSREGIDGTKRYEKKITNTKLKRNNPFVSGR